MLLLDIVYCYVTKKVKFNGDFSLLRNSFKENGFKEEQINETTWKYIIGAEFALEFNYNSEAIQMQVFLKKIDDNNIEIKVGNWGFPFEPLMMKKRFIKNLDRIAKDISEKGVFEVNKEEVQNIKQDSNNKRKMAIGVFIGALVLYLSSKYL